ncbi:MAG: FkbM family methyltransferase, partial [Woeseiales bacterium]
MLKETPDSIRYALINRRRGTADVIVETQVGPMYVDLNDEGIGKKLTLTGTHEPASSEQLRKLLAPGMNVLEVGANIGYYVKLVANEIGVEGRILAFEPSRVNIAMLRKNVELSGLEKIVRIEHSAVGETSGEAELFMMDKA